MNSSINEHLNSDILVRLFKKAKYSFGCWLWTGSNVRGYGQIGVGKGKMLAHRVSYMAFVGPIGEGLTLDHICNTPACINPFHLRPATLRDNIARSSGITAVNLRKTHCLKGHPFSIKNTLVSKKSGHRQCKTCKRASTLGYEERDRNLRRAAKAATAALRQSGQGSTE